MHFEASNVTNNHVKFEIKAYSFHLEIIKAFCLKVN
jgi:hypothetical protein